MQPASPFVASLFRAPSMADLLGQADRLTPMPAVVIKLLDVLRDETASFERVAKVIERDQAITATVLKLANSPLYRGRSEIDTVSQAISRIGVNALRDVVLAVTVLKLPGHALVQVERLRKEMLAAGTASRLLAGIAGVDVERAFVAGLLQDVGRFLLTVVDVNGYGTATGEAVAGTDEFASLEHSWLGFTHAEVGAELTRKWRFPEALVATIEAQHHAFECDNEDLQRMTAVAALGGVIGVRCARRLPNLTPNEIACHPLGEFLLLRTTSLEAFPEDFEEAFLNMSRVFHI